MFLIKQTAFSKLNGFFWGDEYVVLCGNKSLLSCINHYLVEKILSEKEGYCDRRNAFTRDFKFYLYSYETGPRDTVV